MPTISLPLHCFLQTTSCSHSSEHRRANPPLNSPRPPSWPALWSGRLNQISWSIQLPTRPAQSLQLLPPATLAWGCKRTNTAPSSAEEEDQLFSLPFSCSYLLCLSKPLLCRQLSGYHLTNHRCTPSYLYNFLQHLQKSRPHRSLCPTVPFQPTTARTPFLPFPEPTSDKQGCQVHLFNNM